MHEHQYMEMIYCITVSFFFKIIMAAYHDDKTDWNYEHVEGATFHGQPATTQKHIINCSEIKYGIKTFERVLNEIKPILVLIYLL